MQIKYNNQNLTNINFNGNNTKLITQELLGKMASSAFLIENTASKLSPEIYEQLNEKGLLTIIGAAAGKLGWDSLQLLAVKLDCKINLKKIKKFNIQQLNQAKTDLNKIIEEKSFKFNFFKNKINKTYLNTAEIIDDKLKEFFK